MNTLNILILCAIAIITSQAVSAGKRIIVKRDAKPQHENFLVDKFQDNGPNVWPTLFPTCGGVRQSPIALQKSDAFKVCYADPINARGFDSLPTSIKLENNGHSARFTPEYKPGEKPTFYGGPFMGTFVLHQFHHHWGLTDNLGSEHTLDGETYPLEMHIVTYNDKYASYEEALNYTDGVAVVAFFLDVVDCSPKDVYFSPFLRNVIHSNTTYTIGSNDTFSLYDLLGDIDWDVLNYPGSFTIPPCKEVVSWVVNLNVVVIPIEELDGLRSLKYSDGTPMGNNFRPLQPLNGRSVLSFPCKNQ